MAVTWLYLYLALSRLGLRNLGMWAWACTLRYIRFSQMLVGVLGQEEALPWARQCNNCTPLSALSSWVSVFPRTRAYNSSTSASPSVWFWLWLRGLYAASRLLSVEFSRQEYWSGEPFHFQRDLPKPRSHALQADSLLAEPTGKPSMTILYVVE